MAESALSLGYPEIATEVGEFMGYGRTSGNWSTNQQNHIYAAMDSGLRKFLRPLDQRNGRIYEWSFTKGTATLTMVASTQSYDLDDSFGGPRGHFTYPGDNGRNPIRVVGEGEIRAIQARSDLSDYPYMVAITPKAFTGVAASRYQATFYPTPSAAVVITYPFYIQMETRMRTATPYPLGGMVHSETIQAACMASAELQRKTEKGVWAAEYAVLLQTSIEHDKRMQPDYLGKNLDRSQTGSTFVRNYYATVNGVTPS